MRAQVICAKRIDQNEDHVQIAVRGAGRESLYLVCSA
jgi:hypothetical protein